MSMEGERKFVNLYIYIAATTTDYNSHNYMFTNDKNKFLYDAKTTIVHIQILI